ncbi:AbrB family transcriptional regulator [Pseudochelatococcus sp. B33]
MDPEEGSDAVARSIPAPGRCALGLLAGMSSAALAWAGGLPLPFLLGSLMVCAAATLLKLPVAPVPFSRAGAQVVVGLSIGLHFTPDTLHATAGLIPWTALTSAVTIAVTALASLMLGRAAHIDRRTAFFATTAAGMAEMAVLAARMKAASETVAVVHVIRVVTIVSTVPILVMLFGAEGNVAGTALASREILPSMLLLVAAGALALAINPLRIPNGCFLAPAVLGGAAAATGYGPFAMPAPLLVAAQVIIGIWLGCRFKRSIVGRLPRLALSALAITVFMIVAAAALARLLASITGLSFTTCLLAVAPAGITEMAITAAAMHLDVTAVTAFQIMRIAIVMATVPVTLRLFEYVSRSIGGGIE